MNIFTFTGNIGKDCEIKSTQSGMTICSFSAAVSSGFGDKKKTTWVKCALFGKRAEGQLPQYLVKGAKVAVSGELALDEWQDQQGVTQKLLTLAVDKLDLIGDKPPQQQAQAAPQNFQQPQQAPQQQYQQAPQQQAPNFNDDIPF